MMKNKRIDKLIDILKTSTDEFSHSQVAARLGEIATGDDRAISALVKLLATTTDENTRRQAAESLGKIDPGNETAILALVNLLETTTDENTRRQAAESLGEIGIGNERAILALVNLLTINHYEDIGKTATASLIKIGKDNETGISELVRILQISANDFTCWEAAYCLGEVATGNERAISALVTLLETSTDESTRILTTYCLSEIATSNERAISALAKILETSTDENTRRQAAYCLNEIDPGNERAISALVKILKTSTNEFARIEAAYCLGEIDPGNKTAISVLFKLLETSTNEFARIEAAYCLGEIDPGNKTAISVLFKLLETSTNEFARIEAAYCLGQVDKSNERAISALVKLLKTSTDEYIWWKSAYCLGEIATGDKKTISELVRIIETSETSTERRWLGAYATYCLDKIATNDQREISELIRIIETSTDESIWWEVAYCLGEIDPGNEKAISALVRILETSTDENTRIQAAKSLSKIGIGNETATVVLIEFLENHVDTDIYDTIMQYLYNIITSNNYIFNSILSFNPSSGKLRILKKKSDNLILIEGPKGFFGGGGLIGIDSEIDIRVLVNTLISSSSEFLKWKTVQSITSICPNLPLAILALENLLNTTENEFIQWQSVKMLKHISQTNNLEEECNTTIRQYFKSIDNEFIKWQILEDWKYLNISQAVNPQSSPNFYIHYNKIIHCIDVMQEGRDLFSRRLLINSCLEVHHRIIQFCIQSANVSLTFFYTEIFRNRYLVERIAQQDAPLPQTISPALAQQLQTAKQTERQTLQKYTDAISNDRPETELETLGQAWENAKQTLENLYHQVAEIEPEFIAKTKVYPIHFLEVQQLLPTDTAIIEFFFTETELITLLILPGTESPLIPETLRIKLKPNHLETLADDWVADLKDKSESKTDTIDANIQQLSQRIDRLGELLNFTHLNQYIPRQINHLIILPNNYLHLFPIHALPWNESERLIDRFSVRYFPNLHIWKICQNRQRTRDSFLGIENPTADKHLIFAKAEIAGICQTGNFKKTKVLPRDKAKKLDILQSAKNYHCFHFSGHGEYNFTNPLESYLELSANHSENLTLSTIFTDLHLPNADLATLSACCTGVVDAFQPTDECLGIATGFLLAGAKAVVSSLWKVKSIATAFLLDEFYRQLDQTSDKAVALQNAQNWLRTRNADELRERANEWHFKLKSDRIALDAPLELLEDIPFKNPYYWAPFILTGC
jgi:CHAT domain-containing protein/HEAT repeat protein